MTDPRTQAIEAGADQLLGYIAEELAPGVADDVIDAAEPFLREAWIASVLSDEAIEQGTAVLAAINMDDGATLNDDVRAVLEAALRGVSSESEKPS